MSRERAGITERIGSRARSTLGRIEVLALFPLIVLIADMFGFDNIALVTATGLAALLALALALPDRARAPLDPDTSQTGRTRLLTSLDAISSEDGRDTVCLLMQLDDWPDLVQAWGFDAAQDIVKRIEDRLRATLRSGDVLCRLGDSRFGIVLAPMPAARLGIRDTIASRLSEVVHEPLHAAGAAIRLSVGIGHASLRHRAANPAEATFKAAEAALSEALAHGPGAIRAYADGMGRAHGAASELGVEVEEAIHTGAIDAWLQPQVCAQTGVLSGMEVVPRWQHPRHGLLGLEEMQPALKTSGHGNLMGQMMLHRAIEALASFDATHIHVPTISVSLSLDSLRDPHLAETVAEEVARNGLSPDRIAFEITEAVAAPHAGDAVLANLAALDDNGHRLDLGSANPTSVPLLALQDFSVGRIKIDRALTLGVDSDPRKDKPLRAILALAAAMEIQTLAADVSTADEQAHLKKLGCDHLQGFGIGRPIRIDQIAEWVRGQNPPGQAIQLEERRAG